MCKFSVVFGDKVNGVHIYETIHKVFETVPVLVGQINKETVVSSLKLQNSETLLEKISLFCVRGHPKPYLLRPFSFIFNL